jgi:hypothetical protein
MQAGERYLQHRHTLLHVGQSDSQYAGMTTTKKIPLNHRSPPSGSRQAAT